MNMLQDIPKHFKSGYVAIVGAPNAGKSTLMNGMLKEKLAIVSSKPQTTRQRVLGILNSDTYQLILLDTPGLLEPRYLMQQKMMEISHKIIKDADVVLIIVDISQPIKDEALILRNLKITDAPKLLILNKMDLLKHPLSDTDTLEKTHQLGCQTGLSISAKTGQGLESLMKSILAYIPVGFPFYPPDQLTDEPERFFVSEIIREQIFLKYGKEIPYASAVQITEFKEREGRKNYISATITVERDSQKAILIGKEGRALKSVGIEAREEIERFLGRAVFLELTVRVRKNWRKDPVILKQMGFQ